MKLAQIQKRVASAINQDPYKDYIKSVALFGSFLHGTDKPDSDIDLLFEMGKSLSLFQIIEIEDRLSKKLGRDVDLIEKNSLNKYIKDNVLAEAETIYENR